MKIKGRFAFLLVLILALVFAVSVFAACGGSDADEPGKDDSTEQTPGTDDPEDKPGTDDKPGTGDPVTDKEVEEIEIKTEPAKTEYVAGEELDLTGGVLLVTYADGRPPMSP